MIIQCDHCKAKFKLDEDRIKGKGARVKCRKCKEYIIVMKPEFEHLKSHFIDGVQARELRREPTEEDTTQFQETDREDIPHPPETTSDMDMEAEEKFRESTHEDRPDEDTPIVSTEPEKEHMPEEDVSEVDTPPGEEADLPPHDETIMEAEEEADPDMADQINDRPKDDIDQAFEKFLGSLREESKIPLDQIQQEEGDVEIRTEAAGGTEPAEDEEVRITGEAEDKTEETREEEEEEDKPEIISTREALDIMSKEADEMRGDRPLDLSLQDEKLDIDDSFDLSDSIRSKEAIDRGETAAGLAEDSPHDLRMEPPSETLIHAEVDGGDAVPAPETELQERDREIIDLSQKEKPSPFEYVPKGVPGKGKKSRLAGFLLALLIFLVIIAGGGAYLAFTKPGNDIIIKYAPYVQSLFGAKPSVPSNPYDIINLIGYYENNKNAGKIFVIKGEVVNLSSNVNSGLMLKGQLLDEKNSIIADKEVYAGNIIDLNTLRNAPIKTIEESLQNKLGKNLSNIDIQPGSSVPFMIVFFDLSGKIEAYKVENVE